MSETTSVPTTMLAVRLHEAGGPEMVLAEEIETLRPAIDRVFALADARAAFERSLQGGKRGKVVLRVR